MCLGSVALWNLYHRLMFFLEEQDTILFFEQKRHYSMLKMSGLNTWLQSALLACFDIVCMLELCMSVFNTF